MTAALDSATLIFWEKGYRGASLDDLTEAMKINRPSLYSAFGDKEQLFLSVIDHYRSTYIVPHVVALLKAGNLKDGLREFFKSIGDVVSSSNNRLPPGCLIACMLSEECCESEVIRNKLAESIKNADETFANFFQKHNDQLRSPLTPELAGKLMTTTVHGMAIRARSGTSKKEMKPIVDAFIACIAQ
jgi:AcrR family transcriptional regulator